MWRGQSHVRAAPRAPHIGRRGRQDAPANFASLDCRYDSGLAGGFLRRPAKAQSSVTLATPEQAIRISAGATKCRYSEISFDFQTNAHFRSHGGTGHRSACRQARRGLCCTCGECSPTRPGRPGFSSQPLQPCRNGLGSIRAFGAARRRPHGGRLASRHQHRTCRVSNARGRDSTSSHRSLRGSISGRGASLMTPT